MTYVDDDLQPPTLVHKPARLLEMAPLDGLQKLINTWALRRAIKLPNTFFLLLTVLTVTTPGADLREPLVALLALSAATVGILGLLVVHPIVLALRSVLLLTAGPAMLLIGLEVIPGGQNILLAVFGGIFCLGGLANLGETHRMWSLPVVDHRDSAFDRLGPILDRLVAPQLPTDVGDPVLEAKLVVADNQPLQPHRLLLTGDVLVWTHRQNVMTRVAERAPIRWRLTTKPRSTKPRVYLRLGSQPPLHLQMTPEHLRTLIDWLPADPVGGSPIEVPTA